MKKKGGLSNITHSFWNWVYNVVSNFVSWKETDFSPKSALTYIKRNKKRLKILVTPEFETTFLDNANRMFRLKTDAPLHLEDIKNLISITRKQLKIMTPQKAFEYILSLKEYSNAFEPEYLREIRDIFLQRATASQGVSRLAARELMREILKERKPITQSSEYLTKQLDKFSNFTEEKFRVLVAEIQKLKSNLSQEINPARLADIRQSNQILKTHINMLSERSSEAARTWKILKNPFDKEILRWTALISEISKFIQKTSPSREECDQMRGRLLSFEAGLFHFREDTRKILAKERKNIA